jgi:hypothetical protein
MNVNNSSSSNIPDALISYAVPLITSTTVVGVLYTLTFLLYCLCTRLFYFQIRGLDGKIKRLTVLAFIFASIAMICATIDIVSLNLYSQGRLSDPPGVVVAVQGIPVTLLVDNMATLVEETMILGVMVSFMMYRICIISHCLWSLSSYGVLGLSGVELALSYPLLCSLSCSIWLSLVRAYSIYPHSLNTKGSFLREFRLPIYI